MACTPSQLQHTSNDRQFQKEQLKTSLWQLNPIEAPNTFTIKSFCIKIFQSLFYFLCILHNRQQQQTHNKLVPNVDGPFPFASFFGVLLTLFLVC